MSRKSLPSFKKRFPPLPKEEINELVLKAHQGCIASRNKIIEHNLGLIPKHCHNAHFSTNPTIAFEDLYQQSVLGIIEAIKNFDPTRGFAFSTYAVFWIRQRIQRYIQDHKSTIRIPVYALEIKRRYDTIRDKHGDKDEEFWVRLCAKEAGTSYENLLFIIKTNPVICSLDKGVDEDGNTMQITYDLFDKEYYSGLDFDHVQRIINALPERDRDVLTKRYHGATFKSLAREYSLPAEAIRKIISNSLSKIRSLISIKSKNPVTSRHLSSRKFGKMNINGR